MKMDSTRSLTQMSTEELENLTHIVKEGLADDVKPRKIKKFTAVDLWNIRRRLKKRRLQF
jgi:hypothetical protein